MLQRTGSASFLLPGEAHFGNFSTTESINLDRLRALLPPDAAPLPEITFPRADGESRQHVEAFLSWCASLDPAQHDLAQELHYQLIAGSSEPVFRGAVELLRRGALEVPLPEQKPGEHWGHLLARLGSATADTPMQFPHTAISLSDRFETLNRAGFKFDAPGGAQYSPHLAALYADNTDTLKALWQLDPSLINHRVEGRHPLHIAAAGGCEAALNLLLERSPDMANTTCDHAGETPLHCAARTGHTTIVQRLNRQGDINANTQRTDGASPLLLAAKYGQKEVVDALIHAGATVDLPDNGLRTPLWAAAAKSHNTVVETLLSKGAPINQADQEGLTPLHIAAHHSHNAIVKVLLSNGAAINQPAQKGFTPLYIAAQQGHNAVVKTLLSNRAVINQASQLGFTPLHIAAHEGHNDVVATLLSNGAAINQANQQRATPLHIAAHEGHNDVVATLLSKGAAINQANQLGFTPLHIAANEGHKAVVETLLSNGAAINQPDQKGFTPLYIAAQRDHNDVVATLLSKGAAINQAGLDGFTPLHIAANKGHKAVVETLLSNGAAINQANQLGFTPLCIAADEGHKAVVETLLSKGATKIGRELMAAARSGHLQAVRALLNWPPRYASAYIHSVIAASQAHPEVQDLLREAARALPRPREG